MTKELSEAEERRLCRFLTDKINVELPKALGEIVDDASLVFPRMSATAIAKTLTMALRDGNSAEIAQRIAINSIAIKAEERAR
ncbi:MAG: hypothetical protein JNK47_02850 [Mesorhizobium sp.]|nr:hypothetical protein [Mesorhizobium sp.]MBL8576139.1 hypothetical protein [Mesorhizobium sp.]